MEEKPDEGHVLRGLKAAEAFPGEFHQGQRACRLHNRPDISLQPDLKRHHQTSLAKPGGVHISRSNGVAGHIEALVIAPGFAGRGFA
jgi:hypothetical protein